jgi:thioredoxin-related protein
MRNHLALLALLATLSLLIAPIFAPAPLHAAEPEKQGAKGDAAKIEGKLDWLAFDVAAARAQEQKKHLIVDIYTTWCGWCRVMEQQTYSDPEVQAYLRQNFVLAKVNGESSARMRWRGKDLTERQFARAVGVTGYPATYFLKPDAELLGGVGGFLRVPDFMLYARYVGSRWYEKGKISAYADSVHRAEGPPGTPQ